MLWRGDLAGIYFPYGLVFGENDLWSLSGEAQG